MFVSSIEDNGAKTSINIYPKNIVMDTKMSAIHLATWESRKVVCMSCVIFIITIRKILNQK